MRRENILGHYCPACRQAAVLKGHDNTKQDSHVKITRNVSRCRGCGYFFGPCPSSVAREHLSRSWQCPQPCSGRWSMSQSAGRWSALRAQCCTPSQAAKTAKRIPAPRTIFNSWPATGSSAQAGEAHERQRQDTREDQGDGRALGDIRHIGQFQLLAHA